MRSKAQQIAVTQATLARLSYQKGVADRQKKLDRRSAFTGKYNRYDPTLGVHIVRTEDGSELWCDSITNGGLAKGDTVSINRPKGAIVGFMKGMPR